MQGLDNPNMFKYKPKTQQDTIITLANVYINLSKTNPTTMQNENFGQHIFALQFAHNFLSITIYKQGYQPAVQFNITKSLHWNYQNRVYCYFHDDRRNQWLATFPDAATAAYVTAEIYCLTKNIKTDTLFYLDINKGQGKGISLNDTLQVSYFVFPVRDFPILDRECVSVEVKKVKFTKENFISGIANSISGMVSNSSRLIYVPQAYKPYESGTPHKEIPATNVIVMFSLHHVKFEESENQSDASDYIPAQAAAPPPPTEKSDTDIGESDAAAEEVIYDKLRKLQKMGAKNAINPTAVIPPATTSSSSASAAQPTIVKGPSTASLKKLEANINKQIDNIISDPKSADIVTGVIAIANELSQKQEEITKLKTELQSLSKPGGGASITRKQLEFAISEAEDLKKKSDYTEKKLKEMQGKLSDAGKEKFDHNAAKAKGKTIIKKLMNAIFNDVNEAIDPDAELTGSDVNQKLFELLRKHSFAAMEDVQKNGLQ
ncbi:hypothetical protein TVAG_077610 [Trichomonas vaginalis G3]|uniref:Uncharacterized protein n=1 Tax=Trichomonas vaginalis (strain ATCC PRA-98 / G3) TaxID=412133 RepID=A2E2W8_TRIV3|nr:histone peptidyl-prolyl isomerization [Trichomonas vaginalis G3]EAY13023.1 hypothetical protein TVAG_077610 [Trichomonas vaginalis G3]KAI5503078.1 histone peptidyl-prolyl isomerization [Trichomonas vaginalis G3]|eukprot:XP_001325246.1 hypothetical protein [Trichomonas vaginalis G3]